MPLDLKWVFRPELHSKFRTVLEIIKCLQEQLAHRATKGASRQAETRLLDYRCNQQTLSTEYPRIDHRSTVFRQRRRYLNMQQLVDAEAVVGMEMDRVVETGHDLHARGERRFRPIANRPQPVRHAVDG